MNAEIVAAILRYIPSAIVALLADLLAFLLAPVAALPIFIKTDREGREHIAPFWQWITTHDALIDIYIYSKGRADHWLLGRYSQSEILSSPWLRYAARVFWIWRNPAYQVSHWLGYDQRGVALTKLRDESSLWDTGAPSTSLWIAENAHGQHAFLFEKQWYFWRNRCVEMQFGWKLYRNDPDQVCMLAVRFTPFKKYG